MEGFEQNANTHPEGNVQQHTLAAIRALTINDPLLSLCVLAHDYGKIDSYQLTEKGHQYLGHETLGTENVIADFKQLHLTDAELATILYCKDNHMRFHYILDMKQSKVEKIVNNNNFYYLYNTAKVDSKSRGDELFSKEVWAKCDSLITKIRKIHKR